MRLSLIHSKTILFFLAACVTIGMIGAFDQLFNASLGMNVLSEKLRASRYIYFVGFPHVIASFIILLVLRSPRSEAKSYNIQVVTLKLSFLAVIFFISEMAFHALFYFYISQHVVGQMIGPMKNWVMGDERLMEVWKKVLQLALFISFFYVYSGELKLMVDNYLPYFLLCGWGAIAFAWLLAGFIVLKNKSRESTLLILAGQLYFTLLYFFSVSNNLFFWGGLFLIGHDLMAFYYYLSGSYNYFFSVFKCVLILTFSYLVSFFIIFTLKTFEKASLVLLIQMFHYVIEGVAWRKGSDARKYLNFASAQTPHP